jgi:hypothetical protein
MGLDSFFVFFPLHYLAFELTHRLSHGYTGRNRILRNAKRYHALHHLDPSVHYGFLTPFRDTMLGTRSPRYTMRGAEYWLGFLPFYSFWMRPAHEPHDTTGGGSSPES